MDKEFKKEFGPTAGFSGCDFRPAFDGWLYNAHCQLEPASSREEHVNLVFDRARQIARLVLSSRDRFDDHDRFQIIVGWPIGVRGEDRQIIKIGGGFDAIEIIAKASSPEDYETKTGYPFFRRGWDIGVYNQEQGA